MDLTAYIRKSWDIYSKYALEIILAMIVSFIIPGIIFLGGGLLFLIFLFLGIGIEGAAFPGLNATDLPNMMGSVLGLAAPLLLGVILFGISIIVSMIVYYALQGGYFAVIYKATKNAKPTIDDMIKTARERWTTFIGITLIQILIVLLLIGVLAGIFIPLGLFSPQGDSISAMFLSLFGITGIVFFVGIALINMFLSLAYPAAVVSKLGAIDSVKSSISVVRNNFPDYLLLNLIYFTLAFFSIFSYVFSIILIGFIIAPLYMITITRFYADKAGEKR